MVKSFTRLHSVGNRDDNDTANHNSNASQANQDISSYRDPAFAALAVSVGLFAAHSVSGTTIAPGNFPSWNPNVTCQATLATVHQVIGNQFNSSTQGALETGGPFGVLNGTDESSLHPPCMAPNVNGTMAPP